MVQKVNPADFGGGQTRPLLTVEVLGGADVAVLRPFSLYVGPTTDGRSSICLHVLVDGEEYGWWLNKRGITNVVEKLGDDADKWPGHDIPAVKVRNPNPKGGFVVKYEPAPADDWDDYVAEHAKRVRRASAKPAGRKRARR